MAVMHLAPAILAAALCGFIASFAGQAVATDIHSARNALLVGADVVAPCAIAMPAVAMPRAVSPAPAPQVTCSREDAYEVRRSEFGLPPAAMGRMADILSASATAAPPGGGSVRVRLVEVAF